MHDDQERVDLDTVDFQFDCKRNSTQEHAWGYLKYFISFPTEGNITYIRSALFVLGYDKYFKNHIKNYRNVSKSNLIEKESILNKILYDISIYINTYIFLE